MTHTARGIRLAVDVVTAAACLAGCVIVFNDVHTPMRPVLVLAALVLGSGWAICGWMDLHEFAYAGAITVAAGIALWMAVSLVAVEVTWWHPDATVEVVLLLCAFSNIAQILSEIRRMA